MEKSSLNKNDELRSYEVNECSENGIVPRLIVTTGKNYPDKIKLSDEIIKELKKSCEPGELPFVVASVKNKKAVPFTYRKRPTKPVTNGPVK